MNVKGSPRRIPWFGLLLALAIALAVVAFGVFKRKGARKPPPIPEAALGLGPLRAPELPVARPPRSIRG